MAIDNDASGIVMAAIVDQVGQPPTCRGIPAPVAGEGEVVVRVAASALTGFVRQRALGRHYSFAAAPPFGIGIDGIGRLDDGRRVYFLFPRASVGAMARRTAVAAARCIEVPDGIDDASLAALADPGMSAWVALEPRARIAAGEVVLVNGATGYAGRIAVRIAKRLGAARVVVTGRDRRALDHLLAIGADEAVALDADGDAPAAALRDCFRNGIDIVLDYLWGPSAIRIIEAASAGEPTRRVRFVQLGLSGGATIALSGRLLRASAIEIVGSGTGSVAAEAIFPIIGELMRSAPSAGYDLPTTLLPLDRIADAWAATETKRRIVIVMD